MCVHTGATFGQRKKQIVLWNRSGLAYGIYPWHSTLVMGKFDGETFLGGLLIFFLGGRGGKRKRQGTVSRVGRWMTCAFKQPHFVLLLYITQWKFRCSMSSGHRERWSRSFTMPGSDPRIRHRIQTGMFRSIRVDHTNCLQVAIKTHSH